jgi:hypothetical protein
MNEHASPDPRKLDIDAIARRLGAAAMLIAAVFWLWSALVEVSGDIAVAQIQFQEMADLNRYGSAAAVVAAICAMVLFLVRREAR